MRYKNIKQLFDLNNNILINQVIFSVRDSTEKICNQQTNSTQEIAKALADNRFLISTMNNNLSKIYHHLVNILCL